MIHVHRWTKRRDIPGDPVSLAHELTCCYCTLTRWWMDGYYMGTFRNRYVGKHRSSVPPVIKAQVTKGMIPAESIARVRSRVLAGLEGDDVA